MDMLLSSLQTRCSRAKHGRYPVPNMETVQNFTFTERKCLHEVLMKRDHGWSHHQLIKECQQYNLAL